MDKPNVKHDETGSSEADSRVRPDSLEDSAYTGLSSSNNPFLDPLLEKTDGPFLDDNRIQNVVADEGYAFDAESGIGKYDHVNFDAKAYTENLSFKGTRLVYFTSAFVSLFVSLFGYEQGVCLGILTFRTFTLYFDHPSPTIVGLVISILEIGAMISSLLVARILDTYGRKRTILLGTLVFLIGGILQTFASNLIVFGTGRVISGLGVGVLSTIVPLYQCEISPGHERGKLVCVEFSGNIAGYALSVWVDYFCYFIQWWGDAPKNESLFFAHLLWRLPLFIQVLIALVLCVGGLFIVESPRWLLDTDRDQQGFNVLCLLYDLDPDETRAQREFLLIKNSIVAARISSPPRLRTWKHMLTAYRARVSVACLALGFAQLNGINIISYYAPAVFAAAGFSESNALLMTAINGLVYLASTIIPWFIVDRWGRKPILATGAVLMCICLTLISVFLMLDKSYTMLWVAFLVVLYNALFGYSWGPIGFLIPPEVLPLAIRSKGVSLSTTTNWLGNYIVGQMTPVLQDLVGWRTYLFPACSCLILFVVVALFYPETKGCELEDIEKEFDNFYQSPSYWHRARQVFGKQVDKKVNYESLQVLSAQDMFDIELEPVR